MIIIRFEDAASKEQAMGWLPGRYSFKSWKNGEMMLPEEALGDLAAEGIRFKVEGPATYEHFKPGTAAIRNASSAPVQRRKASA